MKVTSQTTPLLSESLQTMQAQDPERLARLADFYRGRRVLITGGLGFIGSTLAIALVDLGARVTIVDSMIPGYGGNLFNIAPVRDRVTVNISDVRDRSSMNYLVQGCECLFNLAGTLSHVDSMTDPFTDLEINCVSQLSILEACRRHNPALKIGFAGTRGQYGRTGHGPVNEDAPMRPLDVNGINNVAGEAYHLLYHQVHGIRAFSLRLTNTFGPRHQMRHHRQGVLNWFLRQLIEGKPVRLYGTGLQIRDTNYVDDVVEAFLTAMADDRADGQVFNVGGEPVSLLEFVEQAICIHGSGTYELVEYPANAKPIEIGDYVADWSRIRNTLGWKPRVALADGIARTLAYYRQHLHHYWDPS